MKGAISNLKAAIMHIYGNDRKAAAQQAEYAHYKLNPQAFCPSPKCKCWGIAVRRRGEKYFERNMTLAQANGMFNRLAKGISAEENDASITGLWIIAFHNGIERTGE